MRRNEERILEYLSDLMSENERLSFENELANSDELIREFAAIKKKLEELNLPISIESDERYFAGILPRIKERLDKKKNFITWKSVYVLTPTAAAVIILSLFFFNSKTEFDDQYKELANVVVNNFSDQEVSDKFFSELESNPADIIYSTGSEESSIQIPSDLELNSDSYNRLIDNPVSEDYRTLLGLSENELEIIYERVNSTTSQKVLK